MLASGAGRRRLFPLALLPAERSTLVFFSFSRSSVLRQPRPRAFCRSQLREPGSAPRQQSAVARQAPAVARRGRGA
ncbi:TPA_asm: MC017.1L [Molluscum contagiosum virus]|uniref:MC017.1L n=1 Tax=Molluscum contagiosum virus TaxID=10279 RepID=A0A858A130_9POXV|nr:MC017.1 [Molluscum contagiosum virus subtype 1]QHW16750.1 MC017.1L [Molluscum contagiosum virus]AQY17119.1 MC017.1 [Molluscum contagiosum virus subtype 1]QHW16932.1 MC017.1L [Molluscum contagiosum virus]QHW17114.1 MC017.1L [Molluscum contagiosum virus]